MPSPVDPSAIARYRKLVALAKGTAGPERDTAERLAAKLLESTPGLREEVARVDRQEALLRQLREEAARRGVPPSAIPREAAPGASLAEKLFVRAVNWAVDTLAESATPEEVDEAIGNKPKAKPNPNDTENDMGKNQAERLRAILDAEGDVDVSFLVDEAEPDGEPHAVEVVAVIPWRALGRIKTKATAVELADWILAAIESASNEAPAEEP